MTYREYLKSTHWKMLRSKAKKNGCRCQACGVVGKVDLHHVKYRASWFDTKPKDLRWLCRSCHEETNALLVSGAIVPVESTVRTFNRTRKALTAAGRSPWGRLVAVATPAEPLEALQDRDVLKRLSKGEYKKMKVLEAAANKQIIAALKQQRESVLVKPQQAVVFVRPT